MFVKWIKVCQRFLTRSQNFNQPSKHPRYMVKCTQLGANPSVPNWVHNLCSKLGFLWGKYLTQGYYWSMYPIGYIIHTPNWVQRTCTQLGAKNLYPIGYTKCVLYIYMYYIYVLKGVSENFFFLFLAISSSNLHQI